MWFLYVGTTAHGESNPLFAWQESLQNSKSTTNSRTQGDPKGIQSSVEEISSRHCAAQQISAWKLVRRILSERNSFVGWCTRGFFSKNELVGIDILFLFFAHSNNHDDVEAHWERIQISYKILSEEKTRKQYDRHDLIHDPGAAMQRAAVGAAVAGVVGIGKGIFDVGASALDLVLGGKDETAKEETNPVPAKQ